MKSFKKTASLIAFFSFVILLVSSIVLYFVPHGRVAYWADWHFGGLSKTEWANIHINVGILFLISIFFHIFYNWKLLVLYMKNKKRKMKFFTKEVNIALVFTFLFTFGTYFEVAPFSSILNLSESIKDSAIVKYGEPPYGHAELSSIETASVRMGHDIKEVVRNLRNDEIKFKDEKDIILDVAKKNNLTPQQLWMLAIPKTDTKIKGFFKNPKSGFGRKSIVDISNEYGLDVSKVINVMIKNNITVKPNMSIKEISSKNNIGSMDLYMILKKDYLKMVKSD